MIKMRRWTSDLLMLDREKQRWSRSRLAREEDVVLGCLALAAASGGAMIVYRLVDRESRALRFYVRRRPALYAVMAACLLVLGACLATNGRVLLSFLVAPLRLVVSHRLREAATRWQKAVA